MRLSVFLRPVTSRANGGAAGGGERHPFRERAKGIEDYDGEHEDAETNC
jgi:hypothetical protein